MYHVTGQLNRYVALVIALATPFAASEQAKSGAVTVKTITIAEGTDMAATVSPNHKTVILDLQGLLYSIPMAGGAAKQISTPYDEDSHPDWSAKGGIVAIQEEVIFDGVADHAEAILRDAERIGSEIEPFVSRSC
jgi:hypothetical protein